jgi:hypothetical protein
MVKLVHSESKHSHSHSVAIAVAGVVTKLRGKDEGEDCLSLNKGTGEYI